MHAGAYQFVQFARNLFIPEFAPGNRFHVVEFGSRNVNGSVRELFAGAERYLGTDQMAGPGVDFVAPAEEFLPTCPVNAVVCCEVLEHTPKVREICLNAASILVPGGVFIITAATDPRGPHSAFDGNQLRPGEYYGNVDRELLRSCLERQHRDRHDEECFKIVAIDTKTTSGDIYAVAIK